MEVEGRRHPMTESIFYFFSKGLEMSKLRIWIYIVLFIYETLQCIAILILYMGKNMKSEIFPMQMSNYLLEYFLITPQSIYLAFWLYSTMSIIQIGGFISLITYYYYRIFKISEREGRKVQINSTLNSINSIMWHFGVFTEKSIIPILAVNLQYISNRVINYKNMESSSSIQDELIIEEVQNAYSPLHIIGIIIGIINILLIFGLCLFILFFSDDLRLRTTSAMSYMSSNSHIIDLIFKAVLVSGWIINPWFTYNYIYISILLFINLAFIFHRVSLDLPYRFHILNYSSFMRNLTFDGLFLYVLIQSLEIVEKKSYLVILCSSFFISFGYLSLVHKYWANLLSKNGKKFKSSTGGLYYIKNVCSQLYQVNNHESYAKYISYMLLHTVNCNRADCKINNLFEHTLISTRSSSLSKPIKIELDQINGRSEIVKKCMSLFQDARKTNYEKREGIYKLSIINASDIILNLFEELAGKYQDNIDIKLFKSYYCTFLFGHTYLGLECLSEYFHASLKENFLICHISRMIEDIHQESFDMMVEGFSLHKITNIDIFELITYQNTLTNYFQNVEKSIEHAKIFWKMTQLDNVTPHKFLKQGEVLHLAIQRTQKYGNILMYSPTTSNSFFIHFLYFQHKIANSEKNIFNIMNNVQMQKSRLNKYTLFPSAGENSLSFVQTLNISGLNIDLGNILSASTYIKKLTGVSNKELVGWNINKLIPEFMQKNHDCYIKYFLDGLGSSKKYTAPINGIIRRRSMEYISVDITVKVLPNLINSKFQFFCMLEKLNPKRRFPQKIIRRINGVPFQIFGDQEMNVFGFSKAFIKYFNLFTYSLDSFAQTIDSIIYPYKFFSSSHYIENHETLEKLKEKLSREQGGLFKLNIEKFSQFMKDNNFNTPHLEKIEEINEYEKIPKTRKLSSILFIKKSSSYDFFENSGVNNSKSENIYWGKLLKNEWKINDLGIGYHELVFIRINGKKEFDMVKKYIKEVSIHKLKQNVSHNLKLNPEMFKKENSLKKIKESLKDNESGQGKEGILRIFEDFDLNREQAAPMHFEDMEPSISQSTTSLISQFNSIRKEYYTFQQNLEEKTTGSSVLSGIKNILLFTLLFLSLILILLNIFMLTSMGNINQRFNIIKYSSNRFGISTLSSWTSVELLNMFKYFYYTYDDETLLAYHEGLYVALDSSSNTLNEAHSKLQYSLKEELKELKEIEEKKFTVYEYDLSGKQKTFELSLSNLITMQIVKTSNAVALLPKTWNQTYELYGDGKNQLFRDVSFVDTNGYLTVRVELDKATDKHIEVFEHFVDDSRITMIIGLSIAMLFSVFISLTPLYKAFAILIYQSKTLKAFSYITQSNIDNILKNIELFSKFSFSRVTAEFNDVFVRCFLEEDHTHIKSTRSKLCVDGNFENMKTGLINKEEEIVDLDLEERVQESQLDGTAEELGVGKGVENDTQDTEIYNSHKTQFTKFPTGLLVKLMWFLMIMIFIFGILYIPRVYLIISFFKLFKDASSTLTYLDKRRQYSEILSYTVERACNTNSTEYLIGDEKYKFDYYYNAMMRQESFLDEFTKKDNPFYPKFNKQIKDFNSVKYMDYLKIQTIFPEFDAYADCSTSYSGLAKRGLKATIYGYLHSYNSIKDNLQSKRTFDELAKAANDAFVMAWFVFECGVPGIEAQKTLFIEETQDSYHFFRKFQIGSFTITFVIIVFLYSFFWQRIIQLLISEHKKAFQILKFIPFETINTSQKLRKSLSSLKVYFITIYTKYFYSS